MFSHDKSIMLRTLSLIIGIIIVISIFTVWNYTQTPNKYISEDLENNQYSWKTYPLKTGDFLFPDDEGEHYAEKEWWYVNGHLIDENNRTFGYMVCFFNDGFFIASITDDKSAKYYDVSEMYDDFYIAKGKLDIQFGENRLYQIPEKPFDYKLILHTNHFQLSIVLQAKKPPLPTGIIPIEQGHSYYYSQTDLNSSGSLIINGNNITVEGKSWIDRQWGSWDKPEGWEWFSIQLGNGMEIMAYKIFDVETKYPTTQILSIMDSNNRIESYNWTDKMYNFRIEYGNYWKSAISKNLYSIDWKLFIPPKNIQLNIIPCFDDQEINYAADEPIPDKYISRSHFWEGKCRVSGEVNGEDVVGNAYVESTYNYESVKGDLIVSNVNIIHDYGNRYLINIDIKNQMPISTEKIFVKIFNGNPNFGGATLKTYFIDALINTSHIEDVINLDNPIVKLFVIVDPDNAVAETNEHNNMKQAEIKHG